MCKIKKKYYISPNLYICSRICNEYYYIYYNDNLLVTLGKLLYEKKIWQEHPKLYRLLVISYYNLSDLFTYFFICTMQQAFVAGEMAFGGKFFKYFWCSCAPHVRYDRVFRSVTLEYWNIGVVCGRLIMKNKKQYLPHRLWWD